MTLKRMYVLVSHEPNQDPRIDWVSRFAARYFQVTVFGMANAARPEAASESQHGYQIERSEESLAAFCHFGCAFCRAFWTSPLLYLSLLVGLIGFLGWALMFPIKVLRCTVPKGIRSFLRGQILSVAEASLFPSRLRRWTGALAAQRRRVKWILRYFATKAVTHYHDLRNLPRPDLIYCNDLDTLLGGVILKRLFGCKLIYDAHEFWAHADPASTSWEIQFYLFLERTLLRQVDAAFTVNHLLAEQMQAALGYPFLSLPNCEPLSQDDDDKRLPIVSVADTASMATAASLAQGRVRFLYQGIFAPGRGVVELLNVWRRVDPKLAVLFLRGPDAPEKTLCLELAKELGILGKSVFFLEPVLERDLVAAAAEVDVGIIPYKAVTINYRYCCPNKLSQYMKAGVALLANDLDYVRSVIERFQCGLTFDIDDETSCLQAINRFIGDEPHRLECQKQAKMMAEQEFNWEKLSRPLYEVCRRLTDSDQNPQELPEGVARAA